MATNTLTNLINDAYIAANIVSRELTGLIPAVYRNSTADAAAKDQVIRVPITAAASATDIEPGVNSPDSGAQTVSNRTITITKERMVPIQWDGNEQVSVSNHGGPGYESIFGNQLEQAMRTLTNEMDADLAALYTLASRAATPAGTVLFDAANYKDLAAVRKELNINGAPLMDRQLVLSNQSAEKFIGNAQNTGADTAGDTAMLNQGVIVDRFGFKIRESANINDHVKGTATSATTNDAGYSVGDTVITLASAGTGTLVAGDIITIADDTTSSNYVVASGDADVSNGGTITLAAPGLRSDLSAATHAITVVDEENRSMAFSRDAIALATRLPMAPKEGDLATDMAVITDPRSGLSFELRKYGQYRRVHYELGIAWGVAVLNPNHFILLADQ